MSTPAFRFRIAAPDDAPALVNIYAPYVEQTAISFEYDVPSVDEFRRRMADVSQKYPYLVAEDENGQLLGYAYTHTFMSEITQKRTRCLPHPRFLLLTHAIHRLLHGNDFKQHAAFALGYAREHDLNGFRVSQGTAQFGNGRIGNKLFVLVGKTLCPLTHMGEQ